MKKTILIIGRFQPFHLGHLGIIKKYHAKGYLIKIGIGSSQKSHEKRNPFTREEREEMIKAALKEEGIKRYQLCHIPDIPNDNKYAQHVEKIVGHFDVIFTGNSNVKKIFDRFCSIEGCEIHYYKERIGGIKATNIRNSWLERKGKKGLPNSVYCYLQKIRASDRLREMRDSKKRVHYLLKTNNLSISAAESCTGGEISRALISYSGSSQFFKLGIVAYDINSKVKRIGVSRKVINRYGTISKETTQKMAERIKKLAKTDYSIASTGYADPLDKKSGTIYIAVSTKNETHLKKLKIKLKQRDKIIDSATKQAIQFLYEVLRKDLKI